ncbi:MAG: hypothetical protein HRT35_04405 [Algicola sp.]|nr:hypothetical protein [Algicola sp.]
MNRKHNNVLKHTCVAIFTATLSLGTPVAVADLWENVPEHKSQNKYNKLSCDDMYNLFSKLKKQSLRVINDKRVRHLNEGDALNPNRGLKTKIRTKMKAIRKAAKVKKCDFDSYTN